MNVTKTLKRGFSLMEMVIVVIIIGILLGAVTKMTSATKSAKASTLAEGFKNLATAAVQYQNTNDGSYQGISLTNLINNGTIGDDWKNGGKAKNPFAGGFKILSSKSGNGFGIEANGIPDGVCSKFKSHKYKVPGADWYTCDKNKIEATYGVTLKNGKPQGITF